MLTGVEGCVEAVGGVLVVTHNSVTGGPVAISVPGGGLDDVSAEASCVSSAL